MTARTALIALVLLAGRAQAAEVNKVRLRELADLPTINVTAGIGFSTIYGFSFNDAKPDPEAEIARLRKQLQGDASDAERYQRLGLLLAKTDHKKESDEAYARAVALCREQVREHPDGMRWLARLGAALVDAGQSAEGEKLLRHVVEKAPKEWRAWLALARYVDEQSLRAAIGDERFTITYADHNLMISALLKKKPTEKQLEEMRRLWKEARADYDRAVSLAPQEVQPYFRRAASNWMHGAVEAGLRRGKGEKVNQTAELLRPEVAADLSQVARLSPDDPLAIGMAIYLETMTCILHEKMDLSGVEDSLKGFLAAKNSSLAEFLPAPSREFVHWGLDRLEQLTKVQDKARATVACEMLADVRMLLDLWSKGEHTFSVLFPQKEEKEKKIASILGYLRRAVELDPSRERAWELLVALLVEQGEYGEAADAARKRLEARDNAHNRFVMAKVYAKQNQIDRAADQLRVGLRRDPKDLNCSLGLSAILLKRDDAKSLKEAGDLLDAAESRIRDEKNTSHQANYRLLRGIHAALCDRSEQANELFKQVLRQEKGVIAAQALVALGQPLTPADEAMATEYLRSREVYLERDDTRSGTPVVRISSVDKGFSDEDLLFLTAFPHLEGAHLVGTSITDAGLVHLRNLPSIRELNLQHTKITDLGLACLKPLTKLRQLELSDRTITDAGLAHLEALQQLEELCIDGLHFDSENKKSITAAGLAHLRKLPSLRDLRLGTAVTDDELAQLVAIPHLRSLDIAFSKITDEGMRHLAKIQDLEVLGLFDAQITDAGVAHLQRLKQLRHLSLSRTKVTGAGLVHLMGLINLESLNLAGTSITDAGLAYLGGLSHLQELDLGYRDPFEGLNGQNLSSGDAHPAKDLLTDAGLKHLEGLTQLTRLNLERRPITDAGLAHLHKLKRLEVLDLSGTKVTPKGIAELRKLIPKLEVSH